MICFFHFISSYSISQGIRKHLLFTRWNSQESAINYVTFLNRTHHEWSIVLQIEELKILRREQYYNSIIILCGHALLLEKNITGRYSKVYRYIGKYRQITFRSFFFFLYQNKLTNTKKKKTPSCIRRGHYFWFIIFESLSSLLLRLWFRCCTIKRLQYYNNILGARAMYRYSYNIGPTKESISRAAPVGVLDLNTLRRSVLSHCSIMQ